MEENVNPETNWDMVNVTRETIKDFSETLDAGIQRAVIYLLLNNVVTLQSCEGLRDLDGHNPNSRFGGQHSYPEPTVDFDGDKSEGWRAFSIASYYGLCVNELRRVYRMEDGEMRGPIWSMTFTRRMKQLTWDEITTTLRYMRLNRST